MLDSGFIAAVALATVFGTVLLGLAMYHVHQCIRMQCLELGDWFHALISSLHRHPEDYGGEIADEVPSSFERPRFSRQLERGKRPNPKKRRRSSHESPRAIIRQRTEEWRTNVARSSPLRERPRRQDTEFRRFRNEQRHRPTKASLFGNMEQSETFSPVTQQQAARPLAQPISRNVVDAIRPRPLLEPLSVQPPSDLQMARTDPAPIQPWNPTELTHTYPYGDSHRRIEDQYKHLEQGPVLSSPIPVRRDYIHICDQYPPIVVEAFEKHISSDAISKASSSHSGSSTSTDSSESTEQITRSFMPLEAFQFPKHIHPRHSTAPRSYPIQWMNKPGQGGDTIRYVP